MIELFALRSIGPSQLKDPAFPRPLLKHVWGHDRNQTTEPSQTFTNPAFRGRRGNEDDDYGEYDHLEDLDTQSALTEAMRAAIEKVRGLNYTTEQSFSLYQTTGTLTSYPFSRHIADPTQPKTHSFLIEWGTEFHLPWSEMQNIIQDISATLVAFADHALVDALTAQDEAASLSSNGRNWCRRMHLNWPSA